MLGPNPSHPPRPKPLHESSSPPLSFPCLKQSRRNVARDRVCTNGGSCRIWSDASGDGGDNGNSNSNNNNSGGTAKRSGSGSVHGSGNWRHPSRAKRKGKVGIRVVVGERNSVASMPHSSLVLPVVVVVVISGIIVASAMADNDVCFFGTFVAASSSSSSSSSSIPTSISPTSKAQRHFKTSSISNRNGISGMGSRTGLGTGTRTTGAGSRSARNRSVFAATAPSASYILPYSRYALEGENDDDENDHHDDDNDDDDEAREEKEKKKMMKRVTNGRSNDDDNYDNVEERYNPMYGRMQARKTFDGRLLLRVRNENSAGNGQWRQLRRRKRRRLGRNKDDKKQEGWECENEGKDSDNHVVIDDDDDDDDHENFVVLSLSTSRNLDFDGYNDDDEDDDVNSNVHAGKYNGTRRRPRRWLINADIWNDNNVVRKDDTCGDENDDDDDDDDSDDDNDNDNNDSSSSSSNQRVASIKGPKDTEKCAGGKNELADSKSKGGKGRRYSSSHSSSSSFSSSSSSSSSTTKHSQRRRRHEQRAHDSGWIPVEFVYGLYDLPSGPHLVLVTESERTYISPPPLSSSLYLLNSSTMTPPGSKKSLLEIRRIKSMEIVPLPPLPQHHPVSECGNGNDGSGANKYDNDDDDDDDDNNESEHNKDASDGDGEKEGERRSSSPSSSIASLYRLSPAQYQSQERQLRLLRRSFREHDLYYVPPPRLDGASDEKEEMEAEHHDGECGDDGGGGDYYNGCSDNCDDAVVRDVTHTLQRSFLRWAADGAEKGIRSDKKKKKKDMVGDGRMFVGKRRGGLDENGIGQDDWNTRVQQRIDVHVDVGESNHSVAAAPTDDDDDDDEGDVVDDGTEDDEKDDIKYEWIRWWTSYREGDGPNPASTWAVEAARRRRPDSRFFWNEEQLRPFLRSLRPTPGVSSSTTETETDAPDGGSTGGNGRQKIRRFVPDPYELLLDNSVPVASAFVGVHQSVELRAPPSLSKFSSSSSSGSGDVLRYDQILIGRRSKRRAGTRFTRRGADGAGDVANYAETEQICLVLGEETGGCEAKGGEGDKDEKNRGSGGGRSEGTNIEEHEKGGEKDESRAGAVVCEAYSHVQTRGSIPLRWSSPADVRTYRPRVRIGTDPLAQARGLRNHLFGELELYGGGALKYTASAGDGGDDSDGVGIKLALVNLIDKHGDQGRLGRAFDAVLSAVMDVYSSFGHDGSREDDKEREMKDGVFVHEGTVRHVWFDFHAECKGGRWDRLSTLLADVTPVLERQGYFCAVPREALENEDEGDAFGGSVRAAAAAAKWKILSLQDGVVRTNCMDCLDRTNVVQSLFARRVLYQQLQERIGWRWRHASASGDGEGGGGPTRRIGRTLPLEYVAGYRRDPLRLPWPKGEAAHRHLWADHADAISRLYAGTPALKGDFTRTGRRTRRGALDDGMNSLQRYYLNNFMDADRQEGMDLLVGNAAFAIIDSEEGTERGGSGGGAQSRLAAAMPPSDGSILDLREAVRAMFLGRSDDKVEDGPLHEAFIKVSSGGKKKRRAHYLVDAGGVPDLRWLPGDLQEHMRSAASEATSNEDLTSKKTMDLLACIDRRASSDRPWWVVKDEDSKGKFDTTDADSAALSSEGEGDEQRIISSPTVGGIHVLGSLVAIAHAPLATAVAVLICMFPGIALLTKENGEEADIDSSNEEE